MLSSLEWQGVCPRWGVSQEPWDSIVIPVWGKEGLDWFVLLC